MIQSQSGARKRQSMMNAHSQTSELSHLLQWGIEVGVLLGSLFYRHTPFIAFSWLTYPHYSQKNPLPPRHGSSSFWSYSSLAHVPKHRSQVDSCYLQRDVGEIKGAKAKGGKESKVCIHPRNADSMPYPTKPCPGSLFSFMITVIAALYELSGLWKATSPSNTLPSPPPHRTGKKNVILRRGSGEICMVNMWKVIRTEQANQADCCLWVLATGKHLKPVFPLWEFGAGGR